MKTYLRVIKIKGKFSDTSIFDLIEKSEIKKDREFHKDARYFELKEVK